MSPSASSWRFGFRSPGLFFLLLCMSLIRGVGAAESFRQRNIFPLPELGPDEGGTTGCDDWRVFANQGIYTLNQLAGSYNSDFHCRKKPTRVQRRVISHITECYKGTFENIDRNDMAGSLSSLCSSSKTYDTGRSDVQPYVRENVSWPEVSNCPVSLCSCMPKADSERLGAWRKHMLRDITDRENADKPVKPYVDPILKNNAVVYGDFLKELSKRNMIKFKLANGEQSNLGVFFVKKKSGQLRLIFDTRKLNESFKTPPTTDWPSADAFTRTEFVEDSQFYIGSGDLANAFYTLAVPNDLAEMFTMPAIEAGKVGIFNVGGTAVEAGTILLPYITVLPMGWSWALHFCQKVLEHGISQAGFDHKQFIGDKRETVVLEQLHDLAVAAYVDNFGVFGANREAVDEGLQKIIHVLRGWGLTVHEIEPACLHSDFVGLSFDGSQGTVSVKKQRILKIKFAIDELLERQFCSGRTMQLLVGHLTWALLCRRTGLSLLNACYAFIDDGSTKHKRLWKSVRQELTWVASVLPLLRFKVNSGWSSDITSSDSSPWGLGVCYRKLDSKILQDIGRSSERWRFLFPDATNAREHALNGNAEASSTPVNPELKSEENDAIVPRSGNEDGQPPSYERLPAEQNGHNNSAVSNLLMVVSMKSPKRFSNQLIGMLLGLVLGSLRQTF